MGSWWAYYTLGWGGWWFWDPVENASFMPWLVGTALIHSLAVTEKRGAFKNWTVLLAISAFSLSLLGTFLVRSGVLTSVHAFATDPRRGIFILAFLTIVIGSSLLLFAWRAPKVGLGGRFALLSRETLLLLNNVLLLVAAASVLLGTLYPLLLDALGLGKLSVGPPYFQTVFVPLMVPLLFLIGLGPSSRWKQTDPAELLRRVRFAVPIALAGGLMLPLAARTWTPLIALGLLLAIWIAAATAVDIRRRLAASTGLASVPRAFWGMHLAHLGIAVFVVGVTVVKGYEAEKDVRMEPGDTVSVGAYSIRFLGVKSALGANYRSAMGEIELSKDGKMLRMLNPEKRAYFSQEMPMTEAAIDTGIFRDIYVSLGESLDPPGTGAWSVRVHYKPFVDWIWGGCMLMALGGLLAASDRRYRVTAAAVRGTMAAAKA
jgi:cytochrome c-type biogenesis protein CcmF